jgi:hypothetical protein
MRTAFVCLMLLLTLGCALRSSNNSDAANRNNNESPGISGGRNAKSDFSSPRAAVETFIAAGTNKDADLLSQCFDAESPGEFRKLREKTASQKDLDSLAEFVRGAQITDVKENGYSAMVSVKFKQRDEQIKMKKSDAGWKIVDF